MGYVNGKPTYKISINKQINKMSTTFVNRGIQIKTIKRYYFINHFIDVICAIP